MLRRSHGLNVGLRYLDGAFNFDCTAAADVVTPEFATRLGLARRAGHQSGADPPKPQFPAISESRVFARREFFEEEIRCYCLQEYN